MTLSCAPFPIKGCVVVVVLDFAFRLEISPIGTFQVGSLGFDVQSVELGRSPVETIG